MRETDASIKVVLDAVLARTAGSVTMADLVQERDEFIAATMAAVPRELWWLL